MTTTAISEPKAYPLSQPLLQALVDYLNAQPAGGVRHLLNAIEAECSRQDLKAAAAPETAP
jgi:hypothetical protein